MRGYSPHPSFFEGVVQDGTELSPHSGEISSAVPEKLGDHRVVGNGHPSREMGGADGGEAGHGGR
jgi:hypothetical protein